MRVVPSGVVVPRLRCLQRNPRIAGGEGSWEHSACMLSKRSCAPRKGHHFPCQGALVPDRSLLTDRTLNVAINAEGTSGTACHLALALVPPCPAYSSA